MGLFALRRAAERGAIRRRSDALSLEDGNVREGPTCAPAPSYEVRMVNDQVEVKMRA